MTYTEGCWMTVSRGGVEVTLEKGICRALVEKRRYESTRDASREILGIVKELMI